MTMGGVVGDLALDCDDLARLNRFHAREAGRHEGQEILETVGLRMENDDCELAGSQILLIFESLVHGEENVEFGDFRSGKKVAVL